jgi:D-alanyl-D-alanine carboxypeptidase/D-alanyl-D-alanine-endopeptidase (penicillin-binding protein 4)
MQSSVKNGLILVWMLFFPIGCSSVRQITLKQELKKLPEKSAVASKYFIGISLYDPKTKEYLIDVNGSKYFTPASNTKILTLATWLATGMDSIPSFRYAFNGSNLYIAPMADPTFLHPDFPIQKAFHFLSDQPYDTLFIIPPTQSVVPFGSGWAWDDYSYSYQPEKSYLPMYGNALHVYPKNKSIEVVPDFFQPYIEIHDRNPYRMQDYNMFYISKNEIESEIQLPFRTSDELIINLLQDTLGRPVAISNTKLAPGQSQVFFGYDRLPVLAQMMLKSDNLLAEHLLMNAQYYKGYEDSDRFFEFAKNSVFNECPQSLEWVDGSGLSRYNMITPASLAKVLEVIYRQLSWKEIQLIFPKGGISGTIKNWYAADQPYVFAKTGTLRHNHSLCGFIETHTGRRLIFSIMNNHYTNGTTEVKQEMQKILEAIRDAY